MQEFVLRNQQYFTLIDTGSRQKWKLDSRIIPFSEFLIHMQEEENQDKNNILTIEVPSFVGINTQIVDLISKYYEIINYRRDSIKVSKLKMKGLSQALDDNSLLYTKQQLQTLSEEMAKKAMNVAQYFKLYGLKQLLSTYIASLNHFQHNQNKMRQVLEGNNIFYSRQMEVNLKRGLMDYGKHFSKELLENLHNKQMQKRKQLNRS